MGTILSFFFPHPFGAPRTAPTPGGRPPRPPTTVILVSGPRGAGKDTAAEVLVRELFPGVSERLALADAVRREYLALHPDLTMEDLTDRMRKEMHRAGIIALSERQKREHGADYWSRRLFEGRDSRGAAERPHHHHHHHNHVYVVSDWRFAEEYEYLVSHGFAVVALRVEASREAREARGVVYNPAVDESHGERGLEGFPFDHVVHNDTQSPADLAAALRKARIRVVEALETSDPPATATAAPART